MISESIFGSQILPFTFAKEGGFTNDPRDPGNWTGGKVGSGNRLGTKFGIAANTYPHLDIRNLTPADAANIYYRDFFKGVWDDLPLALAAAAFDAGVNCGKARPRPWVEKVAGEPIDHAVRDFCSLNLAFHRSLRTWGTYGKGWTNRIVEDQAFALKLASMPAGLIDLSGALPQITPRDVPHAHTQSVGVLGWLRSLVEVPELVPLT